MLLIDHIGNDLSRIENEVEKLALNLGKGKTIDENAIEKYVGISKEFNAFELQAAIAKKTCQKQFELYNILNQTPRRRPYKWLLPAMYNYLQ